MGVFTGSLGAISGVSHVRNWTIEETSDAKLAVTSATRGGTARTKGVRSWSGSASIYGCAPPWMPGDTVSFVGYRNSATDVRNTAGIRSSGSAVIESVAMNWNWNTNDILNTVISFSGSGPVTHASGVAVVDSAAGNYEGACPNLPQIALGATPTVFAEIPDVISAALTISNPSKPIVSSSTNCWTQRKRGPAVDFTLSITQYNELGIGPIAMRDDCAIRLLNTNAADDFWELRWCHLTGITGVTIDVETGNPIQQTLNFGMNSYAYTANGFIRRPGGTTWWTAVP